MYVRVYISVSGYAEHGVWCLGARAAGTDYYTMHNLVEENKDVLQTVFVWIRTIPASRTQGNSGSFTRHRGKGTSGGTGEGLFKNVAYP